MRRIYILLFTLLSVAVLFKILSYPASSKPFIKKDQTILAFGDSITYGYGASPSESYPAKLQSALGRNVINDGVSGELSSQGIDRLEKSLIHYHPRILLLCHGGNDILQKKEESELYRNIEAMILMAKSYDTDVILIAVPTIGLLHLSANPLYEELAQKHGILIEKKILSSLLHDNRYKSDWIHPNAEGYKKMAEAVEKLLRENYRFEE